MKYLLLFLLWPLCGTVHAQAALDVTMYDFSIEVFDRNDSLDGVAGIRFVARDTLREVAFDLAPVRNGKGMHVSEVLDPDGKRIPFLHRDSKLILHWPVKLQKGDSAQCTIHYDGIPADGLIISKNKYGRRTMFADNWPNRAQQWLPCHDRPDDKAAVQFNITAPAHYKVVANGLLLGEQLLEPNRKLTQWKEEIPLPTKVMVIGVADFAVDTSGMVGDIPVSSWVYPENAKPGFYDYALAKDILQWMINYIGPFPYKKLANVQSRTIFGGMENAGAIFYHENSVTGNRSEEPLLAHEIAHQWFGDMATEKSFTHLWLSEGFATYLNHLYLESRYGKARLDKELKADREQVIEFVRTNTHAVVDSTTPYMDLLNANSYQKGGWILHMLRRQLGDSVFHTIIRTYYDRYRGGNANTRDFEAVCESVAGKDLSIFFNQWLYRPGIPQLDIRWAYNKNDNKVVIDVAQLQSAPYVVPLELQVLLPDGKKQNKTFWLSKGKEQFNWPVNARPVQLVADPETSLLFEGSVNVVR